MEATLLDLYDIAARLEAEESFALRYRFPVAKRDGSSDIEIREGKLLDVAEETGRLYVSHQGEVIWVRLEEVVELLPAD
jgi:hypothetical protein